MELPKRRMLKYFIPLLFILLSFKIDKEGPWIEHRKDNIILFTRPLGFSNSPSPDSIDIKRILKNQSNNYSAINSFLQVNFTSQVKIYLYNYDEAIAKIGTNKGGGANTKLKEIYFTYDTTIMQIKDDLLGKHELTHIIASGKLSYPATKLMNEGYANALSNEYAGRSLKELMAYNVHKNMVLTPTEMLDKGNYKEYLFYPQAGYFIKWMFDNYGVECTNKLYPLKAKQIKKEIVKLTGKEFYEIEKEYLIYVDKLKS